MMGEPPLPRRTMLKNIGSNWTLSFVQILVFMWLASFTLGELGDDRFGIWQVVVSLAGPLQLLILGVPMATVRAVSKALAVGDHEEANRAVGASVTLTLILGLGALVLGLLLMGGFEATLLQKDELQANPAWITDARGALMVVLITMATGFTLRLPYALFDAHQDFVVRNVIMATGFLVKLGLTMLFLSLHVSLMTLAWVQLAVNVIEFSCALLVTRRRHPAVRFRPGSLGKGQAKGILSFSVFAFMLNMGALLAFRLDAIVLGAAPHIEVDEIATYSVGNLIFDPFINLLLAIGMVVMPAVTALHAKGQQDEVQDLFLKWSKVATCMVLTVGGYLMVCGPAFLHWWMGDEVDHATAGGLLQILMLSFFIFLPIRGVALPVLMGLSKPRGPALGLVGMGLANLAISIALVGPYGLTGVALGTAIPNVLFGAFFAKIACEQLDLKVGEYLGYVLGRALPAALIAIGVLWGVDRALGGLEGFFPLLLSGLGFVGLIGVLMIVFVWRGDRYVDLWGIVRSRLGRAPAIPN